MVVSQAVHLMGPAITTVLIAAGLQVWGLVFWPGPQAWDQWLLSAHPAIQMVTTALRQALLPPKQRMVYPLDPKAAEPTCNGQISPH
jgi:hypothetical protein